MGISPTKTPPNNRDITPPSAPVKRKREEGNFSQASVKPVRSQLELEMPLKRYKITVEADVEVLSSSRIPNAAFKQYWRE